MKFNFGIVLTILLFSLISSIDATFCDHVGGSKGKGHQIKSGFCSDTALGQVPSVDHMTSVLIIEPKNEAVLKPHKDFTVRLKIKNLKTGHFSDPEKHYYDSPQRLTDGKIEGHTHITIQKLDDEKNAPDAKEFAFFEGINTPAKDNILKVEVDGSKLSAGRYRICSMSSSFGHQPLVMPVAKRGAQDDCIRVTLSNRHKRTPRRPLSWKV
ncbi:hypothetical protein C2G38_1987002 [Gigaspora rosea]|uniref:Phosphatidylglycerol/phosphatidylinositol transfer protein n=1 Tax=Gigaspora rosea TaxID=44941 RepID=A0A397U5E9_9GLOM|nr:hypothetical protein C2G38_1987002 [Gigaspora rosea]